MKRETILAAASFALLAAAAAACAAVEPGPKGAMIMKKTCAVTECESRRQECVASVDSRCDGCYDDCFEVMLGLGDSSCMDLCDRVCDDSHCYAQTCGKRDDPCLEQEFTFTVTADVDWPVLRACERLTANKDSCWGLVIADCGALSRVLLPEAADALDCTAGRPCDACYLDCWNPDAMASAGSLACSTWSTACGSTACMDGWALFFDVLSPWMRPGVARALETCLGETGCEDLTRCIDAWSEAAGFSLVIG
jgi:hypothetical protein